MEEEKDKKGFTGRDFGSKTIPILGELESRTKEGITAAAGTIYDYAKEKFQQTINEEYGQQIELLNNSFNEVVQNDIIPRLNEAEEKVDNNIPYTILYENQYINIPCDAYGNYTGNEDSFGTKVRLLHGNVLELLSTDDAIDDDIDDSITQYINAESSGDRTFGDIYITAAHLDYIGDYLEVPFHVKGESGTTVSGKVIFNKVRQGKSAFDIWKDEDPVNRVNATPAMFILDLKNVDGVYGPKYAPDETTAISDADGSTVVYFIPNAENSTKYDIVLVEGGEAKPLATEISGDITNYAGIYNVSEDNLDNNNNPTKYPSLSAAIGDIAGTAKKAGMTIKYIGTDGKYHQYRYTGISIVTDDFTDVGNWETAEGLQSKFLHVTPSLEITHNVRKQNTFRSTPLGLTPGKKYKVHAQIPSPIAYFVGIYMSEVNSGDSTGKLVNLLPNIEAGETTSDGIYIADDTHIYLATWTSLNTANFNMTVTFEEVSEVDKVPMLYDDFGEHTDGAITQKFFTDKFSSESFLVKEEGVALSSFSPFSLPIAFVHGYRYKIVCRINEAVEAKVGFSLYTNANGGDYVALGYIEQGETTATFDYTPNIANAHRWLAFWTSASADASNTVSFEAYKIGYADLSAISSAISEEKNAFYFKMGGIHQDNGLEINSEYGFITDFIPIGSNDINVTLNLYSTPSIQGVYVRKYKNGQYISSDNLGATESFTIHASDDYDRVRINIYFSGKVTSLKAKQSYLIVNPPVQVDVRGSSNDGGNDVVYIEESDLEIDLSNQVLDLSSSRVTSTNKKFNESGSPKVYSEQSNNYWRMIDTPIEENLAGVYYIMDDAGVPQNFQVALIDENDTIKYLHGTNGGKWVNMISNALIELNNAVKLKIAVKTNGLTGLHLVKGRKFIITDETKRAAFDNQCPDGKINVAYIKNAQDSERIRLALMMAGDFGIVKIPSGRYVLSHTIWAGLSCQSIEMNSDTVLVPSDDFTNNSANKYIMEWDYPAIDASEPEFCDIDGNSFPIGNTHITGGAFDAKGLCGGLRVMGFRGMTIDRCQFLNAKTKGVSVEKPSYELIMSNCVARNDMAGLNNNIAFNFVSSDCHYHDLIAVGYTIGFRCRGNAFLTRCHAWISKISPIDYYPNSIAFDAGNTQLNDGEQADATIGDTVIFTDCYADTTRTHYRLGNRCRMIGCISFMNTVLFPELINEQDTILIDSKGSDNVLIGCVFRGSGSVVHYVRNSDQTNHPIKEIGTTVSLNGGASIDVTQPYV